MASKYSPVVDTGYRICSNCKNRKPSEHFHKKGKRFDSVCRPCRSSLKKEQYREKKAKRDGRQGAEVVPIADPKDRAEELEKMTTNQPMLSFWSNVYGRELTTTDIEFINQRLVSLLKIMEEISKTNGKEL